MSIMDQVFLRWFPSKRTHHRFPMKLGMLLLQYKEMLKTYNVIKRGSHHAWFDATILTSMVLKVTFGYLGAQQISLIIFQCTALYHTEFDFLGLCIHLRPRKMSRVQISCIFLSFKRKDNLDMHFSAHYVSPCRIHFICQKSSHRFL